MPRTEAGLMRDWSQLQPGLEALEMALMIALLKPQLSFLYDWTGGDGTLGTSGCSSVKRKLSPRARFSGQQACIPHRLLDIVFPIRENPFLFF